MEVVGEYAGGVARSTLDGRGMLWGDHAGGHGKSGGLLVGGGQDVEDVADEHLVDALELAAQDLVAGAVLLPEPQLRSWSAGSAAGPSRSKS